MDTRTQGVGEAVWRRRQTLGLREVQAWEHAGFPKPQGLGRSKEGSFPRAFGGSVAL